jgi:universal stress protein A
MILDTARERGSDILVMGSHSHHGIAGYLGSTTDYVVHGAQCDVLVVKAQMRARPEQQARPRYRSVLVPVDFSSDSQRILERAASWAEQEGAQITLLHVEEHFPVDRSNECITPEDQDPAADLERQARASLARLARAGGTEQAAQAFQFSVGAAKHAIVAAAEQQAADLIVLGSHGADGPRGLLGSTCDGVLHRSPCDVLLVRVRG